MYLATLIAGLVCVAIWVYLLVGHGHFWRIPLPPALAKRGPERGTPGTSFSPGGVILSGATPAVGAAESKDPYTQPAAPSCSPSVGERVGASVAVVIPARNEADVIGRAVASLLRQRFASPTLSPKSGEEDGAPAGKQDGTPGISLHIFVVDDNSSDGTADVARQAALEHPDRITVISGRPLPPGWTGKLWAVQQGVEQALMLRPDYILLTDADIEHSTPTMWDHSSKSRAAAATTLPPTW